MSQPKIYVGNLSYNTSEDELREFFSNYGNIEDIKLIIDFATGRSKGFGFITFGSAADCEKAVAANGVDLGGRKLKVNIAREDERRAGGGHKGGANGGGFGGGFGGTRRPNSGNRSFNRDRDDRS